MFNIFLYGESLSHRGKRCSATSHLIFSITRHQITNPDATRPLHIFSRPGAACLQAGRFFPEVWEMQRIAQAIRLHGSRLRHAVLLHLGGKEGMAPRPEGSTSVAKFPLKGLENTTVADLLKQATSKREAGEVFWCTTTDTVYDAVKHMTEQEIGSLVVLKPGEQKLIAGIVTERDYLRKIIVQGRSSRSTSVGEIMTGETELVTVSSDTSILQAMELMTENRIRHIPVIDKKVVGMISIVDVVRAVVDQQRQEVQRLNDFIRGGYY